MPIYEYLCGKCDHEFEVEQRITDSPVKTCPECRSRKVKRLISQTSFVLKGSGWYSDLYSSPSGKDPKEDGKDAGKDAKDAGKDGKDAPEGKESKESKDTSKGDSKSEKKSKPGGKGAKKGGKAAA